MHPSARMKAVTRLSISSSLEGCVNHRTTGGGYSGDGRLRTLGIVDEAPDQDGHAIVKLPNQKDAYQQPRTPNLEYVYSHGQLCHATEAHP